MNPLNQWMYIIKSLNGTDGVGQVDEYWNAKVADFGFGPIKEESMTYCCAPAWTGLSIFPAL